MATRRERLGQPRCMVGSFEGWMVTFVTTHHWKFRSLMDLEDALQEARLLFYEVDRKYNGVEDRHLMSLYQSSLRNWVIDQAAKSKRERQAVIQFATDADSKAVIEEVPSNDIDFDRFGLQLRGASEELCQVVRILISVPTEILDLAAGSWKIRGKKGVWGNAMLCSLIGADPAKVDVLQQLRSLFDEYS